MSGFLSAPKALLPLWLLAAIVLAGTAAGVVAGEAGANAYVAMGVAAAVSWPAAMVARRMLAARGRTGFEDLPSADFDYNDSSFVQANSRLLDSVAIFVTGTLAGLVFHLTGLDGTSAFEIPGWVLCGWVAAGPVMWEADARYGLRVRRKRLREEALIEGRAEEGVEEDSGPAPESSPVPLTDAVVVPIHRRRVVAWGLFALAMGLGCLALGIAASDMNGFERVAVLVGGPCFVFVSTIWFRHLRRPYFLRLTSTGADLLGAGEVPWDAIESTDVSSHSLNRWFALVLEEPLGDQPWATPRMKPLAKMSKGSELTAMTRVSAWPADRLAAAVRQTGRVEVEAYLA